ncbi:hypothetical protein B0T10DRAFT_11701 [Thelonectria olida]|uniref:MICOS complex subunit MIC12 n=1 Tax=Thelonectria olida TaxID=1576542 RepID=A0A9P8WK39_9HYPO|nr:hypothetical protein B0T10DRAFT_11701 [Thelonectria olida]
MGFTTGFTGGVTLTLSLAYLTVLTHQRNREQQGQALRAQALALQGLVEPFPPLPPPTRSEVAAAQRATAVEVAKDRWNTEVMNAVRWVQRTDWVQVREGLEESASRLFGYTVNGASDAAEKKIEPALTEGVVKVAAAATGAFEEARAKGKEVIVATIENGKEVIQNLEGGAQPTLSPVQMALNQRYEKPSVQVHKTVEQALAERYQPVDKRDTSLLRGV